MDTKWGRTRIRILWSLGIACLTALAVVSARGASEAAPVDNSGRPLELAAPQVLGDAVLWDVAPGPVAVLVPAPRPLIEGLDGPEVARTDAGLTRPEGAISVTGVPGLAERVELLDRPGAAEAPRLLRLARVPLTIAGIPHTDTVQVKVGARVLTVAAQVDDFPDPTPQRHCDPRPKPGVAALAEILLEAHPGSTSMGISRACDVGAVSEHKEGRAFDWGVTALDVAEVDKALARLLAPDRQGNEYALVRRMGIMYMVWNGKIWSARLADQGWRTYTGPHGHHDHVHFSMSWEGALGHTTLWRAMAKGGWLEATPSVEEVLTALALSAPDPAPSPSPSSTPTPRPTPTPTAPEETATRSPRPRPTPSSPPSTRPSPGPTTPGPSPGPTTPGPSPGPATPGPSPGPTTPGPSPGPTTPSPSPTPAPTPSPLPGATASPTPPPSPTPSPSPSPSPTPSPTPAADPSSTSSTTTRPDTGPTPVVTSSPTP